MSTPPDGAPRGRLYVVATPLGNREDLSPRAIRVLGEVDLVACEDTRHTALLLRNLGVTTPLTSYFEHNERTKALELLKRLEQGESLALVCDAGTPGISDPGFRLVSEARARDLAVIPVPGPSALTTALSVSGLPTDRFLFVGFLPSRAGARQESLRELADRRETLVFYESPVRLLATLEAMKDAFGEREAFLCREATKVHEEYVRAPLSGLLARVAAKEQVKGEVVLVVAGAPEEAPASDEAGDALVERLVAAGLSPSAAAKEAARRTGLRRRDLYRRRLS
jgi:16S rRNA (cytidine1402-2'-O)-methyltransferase